ncbi:hypothetical protein GN956_G24294 [Arapaima gigas]
MRWIGLFSLIRSPVLWLLGTALPATVTVVVASPSAGSHPPPQTSPNSTLLFDSTDNANSLRNCSCASEIQDCNNVLANLLCSCRTVLRSSLSPAGLSMQGGVTVWVHNTWLLRELLNGSVVLDLRLSACSSSLLTSSAPPPYLALFGLRRLRVYSSAPGATHPEQTLTIPNEPGREERGEGPESSGFSTPAPFHISFLDMSLLNGLSSLKAYSVSSPSAATIAQHFPHLPMPVLWLGRLGRAAPHNPESVGTWEEERESQQRSCGMISVQMVAVRLQSKAIFFSPGRTPSSSDNFYTTFQRPASASRWVADEGSSHPVNTVLTHSAEMTYCLCAVREVFGHLPLVRRGSWRSYPGPTAQSKVVSRTPHTCPCLSYC